MVLLVQPDCKLCLRASRARVGRGADKRPAPAPRAQRPREPRAMAGIDCASRSQGSPT